MHSYGLTIISNKVHYTCFIPAYWLVTACTIIVILALCAFIRVLLLRIKNEKILNYFATSLYGKNTVEDVFWDIAKNCISKLGLQDCVIYLNDETRRILIQIAAFGPKNPAQYEIFNPIEIPVGEGIVGTVAITGKPEIIKDTSKDSRYIVDDVRRLSEITIPIFVDGKVFGVIDAEHSKKNFFYFCASSIAFFN